MEPDRPVRPYHHGNLRAAVLDAALDAIDEAGPSALSVRDVARRAGVTHTAVAHHFGDRAGVLTAVAVEGYGLLAAELAASQRSGDDFLELGVAYVRFAVGHRAHFAVMFRPELVHADDPALAAARATTRAQLHGGPPGRSARRRAGAIAGWALVHGLATLWVDGALPPELGDDPETVTREVARHLQPPAGRQSRNIDR